MSESIQKLLSREDVSVDQGWLIAEWCLAVGGDEFTLSCMSSNGPAQFCEDALAALKPFARGEAIREVVYGRKERVPLWELTPGSLATLRRFLSDGVFTYRIDDAGWIEDLTLYRRGEMLLGVVTHEETACLSLSQAEWDRFGELGIRTRKPNP